MAELDREKIVKLKRGELAGNVATACCGIVLLCFAVCYIVARVRDMYILGIVSMICAPVFLAAGVCAAAFCYKRFGAALSEIIRDYTVKVFVENASLMHPDKTNLSFTVSIEGARFYVKVNNFKERIAFDFSCFGKLSAARKSQISSEIMSRLIITFCRLFDRGAEYSEVSCVFAAQEGEKPPVYIIRDGMPDKKAYAHYLKNK